MTAQSRDTQILEKIQGYCNDIMFTHTEYAHDYHTFCTNPTYRNAIALCLMQIGELVKHLSPEFISLHTSIPDAPSGVCEMSLRMNMATLTLKPFGRPPRRESWNCAISVTNTLPQMILR